MQFITGTRQWVFKWFDEFSNFFFLISPQAIWCTRRWRLLMDSFNQKLTRKYKRKTSWHRAAWCARVPWTAAALYARPSASVLYTLYYCSHPTHLIITVRLGPKRFEGYFENLSIVYVYASCMRVQVFRPEMSNVIKTRPTEFVAAENMYRART